MTNFEICVEILNDMVNNGYFMFGETVEHMVERVGADPIWWSKARAYFFQSKGIQA